MRSAAIVTAIVIGDRAGLDESVQQLLQQAGTYHVIAISGGNIAILAGLMLGFFRWAGALGRIASLVSMAVLVAYGGLNQHGVARGRGRPRSKARHQRSELAASSDYVAPVIPLRPGMAAVRPPLAAT